MRLLIWSVVCRLQSVLHIQKENVCEDILYKITLTDFEFVNEKKVTHPIIRAHSVWWMGWKETGGEWCDKGGKCQEGRVPPTCLDRWDTGVGRLLVKCAP